MKRIIPLFFLFVLLVFSGCDDEIIHTVVFDDCYGSTSVQYVRDGNNCVKPYKNPTAPKVAKKGSFKAWITISEGGVETEYDFTQPIKADLHLYATYHEAYTVSFYKNKTEFFEVQTVSEGDKAEKPSSDPEDPNMGRLKGWSTDPERPDETSWNFDTPVTSDMNLYAAYSEAEYVTLLSYDGTEICDKIKLTYKDVFPRPSMTECGDRIIEKWQIKNGEKWEDYDFSLPVLSDITLKALCYDAIPSSSISEGEALSLALFAEMLVPLTGTEEGEGTTSGFKNVDLVKLSLALSQFVDPVTLNFQYTKGDVSYVLYIPGESLNLPENILYCEIVSASAERYSRNYEGGETSIKAGGFKFSIRLGKGKLVDGAVVKDGDYLDTSALSLSIDSLDLKVDKSGNIDMSLVMYASDTHYDFTLVNERCDSSTVSTFVVKKAESSGTSTAAMKKTFYTVTFDPDNGEDVKAIRLPLSKDGAKVNKPDEDPLDSELNRSFRYWTKNGVEYDFTSRIEENTVLKARYFTHEDYYNRILVAECIYKIPTLLSSYGIYNGETQFSTIFDNTTDIDHDIARILLSSLFSIDGGSEKLCVTCDGLKYDYEDGMKSFIIHRLTDQIRIGSNSSKADGNTKTIKIDDFILALQFEYKKDGTSLWSNSLKETFSIDATITTGTEETITTVIFKAGGKTYEKLTATASKLKDGKTKVVFEYDGLKFSRIY